MKMIQKILALSVGVMMIFQMASFADTSSSNVYTWEQIADMAIKKNVDFKTTEVDKMKLGRQMDDLVNNVNTLQNMGVLTFSDKRDKTDPLVDNITLLQDNRETIDENISLKKEVLRDTIKNLYVTTYKYEKQLDSLNDLVKLNVRLLEVDRKKLKLGLISTYDLEKNYNSYQKTERTANSLKTNISKLYTSIKDLAGIDNATNLVLDYTFIDKQEVLPVAFEPGFQRINSGNLKIQMYSNNVKRANGFRNGVKNRYPSGTANFAMADLDYDKAQLTLDNAVASLPYKYQAAYDAVVDAYESYNQKQKEYTVKSLEMKNTVLKKKIGSSSTLEVTVMETQMRALNNELLGVKMDYVSAMNALESTIKGTN